MPKLDDQISLLQEKLNLFKLRQERLDLRKKAIDAQRARKLETRRRILVGAVVLAKAERGEIDAGTLRAWLDEALTRSDERSLFELPEKTIAERNV